MIPFEPISRLQRTWLQEVGVDRSLLMRLPLQPEPASSSEVRHEAPYPVALERPAAHASSTQASAARDQVMALVRPQSDSRSRQSKPSMALEPIKQFLDKAPVFAADLEGLHEQVKACRMCSLHEGRALTVFGRGDQAPDWLIVGEAPGASDDRSGRAFDGQAGELLHAMLNSVLPQATFYLTHLVKCRPLGNRTPRPDELAACKGFLDAQIVALRPKRILAVGRLAARVFGQHEHALETLRGQVLEYQVADGSALPLMLSYHPASLLLRPQHKANAWRDLILMQQVQKGGSAT